MNARMDLNQISRLLILSLTLLLCLSGAVLAQDSGNGNGKGSVLEKVDKVLNPDGEIVKLIEAKEKSTQETVAQKEEKVAQVKKEAEQVLLEKETVEKEVEIKEQEALVVKQELETAKKEAEIAPDPSVKKKVAKLETEAKKIDQEAAASKEKLDVVQSKAGLAQKKLSATEDEVVELRKELEELRREKLAKRSWVDKGMRVATILLIGLVVFILLELIIKLFQRILTPKNVIRESDMILRLRTLSKLFHWVSVVGVTGVVGYTILENVGVDVRPLLAGAGIIGLAFGFGGQYLIRDIINGVFILFEGQYRIDDVVKIGEHGGLVEDVNLRITTLRDLEGRAIIIPNGEIKTVINFTKYYAQALLNIGVAYKENVDRVMTVIKEIGQELRQDPEYGKLILDDLEMLGVDDFADSQVTIKFRIKTLPIKQWAVAREFRRRIKNRFDELGIEIPFPHTTLYWGTDKDNEWMKEFARKHVPVKTT